MATHSKITETEEVTGEDYEVLEPPSSLRHLIRKTPGDNKLDLSVVVKAEAALEKISSQFPAWISKELEALRDLREEIRSAGLCNGNIGALDLQLQCLRDCAATFGFPFAGQVAGSLCRVIAQVPPDKIPADIIENHFSAIFAIVNENAKGDGNTIARKLSERLCSVTQDYLNALQSGKIKA